MERAAFIGITPIAIRVRDGKETSY